jgi:hypothetical protein
VFDARDPADRAWERWPVEWHRTAILPCGHTVEQSIDVDAEVSDTVSHTIHYRFGNGDELHSSATLRFRTEDELRESLQGAGFTIEQIYGGWRREPIGQGDGEFLFIARADARKT